MRYLYPDDEYSIITDMNVKEWYFLTYDYIKHKKKLFNIKDFLNETELRELKDYGIKIKFIGDKNEVDFAINGYHWIHNLEEFLEPGHEKRDYWEANGFAAETYGQHKYMMLSSKHRGFSVRFHDLSEKFYSLSYDGDVDGRDYEDFLEINRAGREDYFQEHGKYPESDEEDEKWDFKLRFEYSDKNKALKDEKGNSVKKKSHLELDEKAYYDLLTTNNVTCIQVINYITLHLTEEDNYGPKRNTDNDLLNKIGDRYPVNKLRDIKKCMPFNGQFMILVDDFHPDTTKITCMSVHFIEREKHFMYYFFTGGDAFPLMRIIRVPDFNMNPVDRHLHPHGGIYNNGIPLYDGGLICLGGQNEGNFLNYALAEKENIPILDDLLPPVKEKPKKEVKITMFSRYYQNET